MCKKKSKQVLQCCCQKKYTVVIFPFLQQIQSTKIGCSKTVLKGIKFPKKKKKLFTVRRSNKKVLLSFWKVPKNLSSKAEVFLYQCSTYSQIFNLHLYNELSIN